MKKYMKPLIAQIFLIVVFCFIGNIMGISNMFSTILNTAYSLLIDTVFYIMAIAVVAGAFSGYLTYTGITDGINILVSPLMRPLYGLPGAAAVGVFNTFFSDNPAIIPLIKDEGFTRHFRNWELPCLCNMGTSFGMGFVVWVYMSSQGGGVYMKAATVGLLSAVIGSVFSTRFTLYVTKKKYRDLCENINIDTGSQKNTKKPESFLDAMLDGGRKGVDVGIDIIPGVLIISTFIMILINGPSEGGVYTGAAYEGIDILRWFGDGVFGIFRFLFGFRDPKDLAFPLTALGSVGASLGIVPALLKSGAAGGNEIAVFTGMGMCWSGYLSTHIAMMDSLNIRKLAKPSILAHTFGGLIAGISAHLIYSVL